MTGRRGGMIATLVVGICVLATACGTRSADPEAGVTTVTTASATTEITGTTESVEAPAGDPAPVDDAAPAGDPTPIISDQEIEDLERTLDEIDQILADLEEDLARD